MEHVAGAGDDLRAARRGSARGERVERRAGSTAPSARRRASSTGVVDRARARRSAAGRRSARAESARISAHFAFDRSWNARGIRSNAASPSTMRRKNSPAAGPPCSATRRSKSARKPSGAAARRPTAAIGGSISTAPAHELGSLRGSARARPRAPKLEPTTSAGGSSRAARARVVGVLLRPIARRSAVVGDQREPLAQAATRAGSTTSCGRRRCRGSAARAVRRPARTTWSGDDMAAMMTIHGPECSRASDGDSPRPSAAPTPSPRPIAATARPPTPIVRPSRRGRRTIGQRRARRTDVAARRSPLRRPTSTHYRPIARSRAAAWAGSSPPTIAGSVAAVALKELLDPAGEQIGRFQREALITARLQHPGIVPVYEAGRWPIGEPFFAMKLVSGRPLDKVIAEATHARGPARARCRGSPPRATRSRTRTASGSSTAISSPATC